MSLEFELIEVIQARCPAADGVIIGIGDDASVLQPSIEAQWVTTTDTVLLDRHFTQDWSAEDIGHLAMAVNLSDLAAMGAKPRWALLSLTLPNEAPWATKDWLNTFLDGLLSVCPGVALVGGNMASGPLNIGVCLIGEVAPGQAVTRQGAQAGDLLVVTGTLGDSAAALALKDHDHRAYASLHQRLRRPSPRISVGLQAFEFVNAMIDISDGLLADLNHLLSPKTVSAADPRLGAELLLDQLPSSDALKDAFPQQDTRWPLQLSGGSDYELLMSVCPKKLDAWLATVNSLKVPATVIGEIKAEPGVVLIQPDGEPFHCSDLGWDHFDRAHGGSV